MTCSSIKRDHHNVYFREFCRSILRLSCEFLPTDRRVACVAVGGPGAGGKRKRGEGVRGFVV